MFINGVSYAVAGKEVSANHIMIVGLRQNFAIIFRAVFMQLWCGSGSEGMLRINCPDSFLFCVEDFLQSPDLEAFSFQNIPEQASHEVEHRSVVGFLPVSFPAFLTALAAFHGLEEGVARINQVPRFKIKAETFQLIGNFVTERPVFNDKRIQGYHIQAIVLF